MADDRLRQFGVSPRKREGGARLTGRGAGLLLLSLGAVIIGAMLPEPLLVQLGLFGIVLLAAAWPVARSNLNGLTLSRSGPESAFAGQLFPYVLTIRNSRRFDSIGVDVEDGVAGPAERGLHALWLPAGGSVSREFPIRVLRRGTRVRVRSTLISTFPLGLWRTRRELRDTLNMTVYPRPVSPRALPDAQDAALIDAEEAESLRRDWAGDFHGIRQFQPGDRLKLIHWPSTARSREIMVRQFDRRLPEKYSIFFHSIRPGRGESGPDAFESAMELLCGLLVHCRDQAIPLDLTASFLDWRTVHVPNPAHIEPALEALAAAQRTPESDPSPLLRALSGVEAGSRVFVLSDVPGQEWEDLLPEFPFAVTCLSVAGLRVRQPGPGFRRSAAVRPAAAATPSRRRRGPEGE